MKLLNGQVGWGVGSLRIVVVVVVVVVEVVAAFGLWVGNATFVGWGGNEVKLKYGGRVGAPVGAWPFCYIIFTNLQIYKFKF